MLKPVWDYIENACSLLIRSIFLLQIVNDQMLIVKNCNTFHDNLRVYSAACPDVDLVRPMLRLHRVAVEALPPVAEPLAGVIAAEGTAAIELQLPHHRVACPQKMDENKGKLNCDIAPLAFQCSFTSHKA